MHTNQDITYSREFTKLEVYCSTYMQSQIERIAGIELALEGQREFVHFEDLAVLLIVLAHPMTIGAGVGVGDHIEEAILILKETNICIGQAATFRKAQIEPTMLLIERILQMEEHLLLIPVNHPAQLDFLVIQKDLM